MLDVQCWMFDLPLPLSSETPNIQHRTLNIERNAPHPWPSPLSTGERGRRLRRLERAVMTVLDPSNLDLPDLQRQLVGRLEDFARRVRTHLLVEGAARVLAVAVALGLLSLLIDRWLRLGLATRLVLLGIGLAVVAVEAWRHLVVPLRLTLSPVALAAVLDRRGNGASGSAAAPLASRVASVLQ